VNVISNLLDNAIKYSDENEIDISLSTNNNERGIEVIVDDKGIGIPKSERENVFEKFHRVNISDRHDVKGFGVGLYYVGQVIKAMNAKITLIDNKEKYGTEGSKFIIQINKKGL
jgi:two-component system phosphate regulon sensor histidine kinase PhoR